MRTAKLLDVFVVVLSTLIFLSGISYSDPLDNWHWRNPVPTGNDLTAIAYGNGIFVAVGAAGTILTSPDGVIWTQRTSGDYALLKSVMHGNGTFVAVGQNGTILTSQDGVSWTIRTSGVTADLFGVTYGNDIFIAVGGNSYDCYCPCPEPPCRNCCPAGRCCPAIILTSPDGINWTSKILGQVEFGLTGVTYGNGIFIAFDPLDSIFISSNGVDWSSSSRRLKALTFGNGVFVGIGSDNTVQTSPDGVTWTAITSQFADTLNAVSYGNGTFVAVGQYIILTSADGENWIRTFSWVIGNNNYWKIFEGVTYGNGTFVVVGAYGTILTSPDGVTWTEQTSRVTSEFLRAVVYGEGTFVAVGDGIGSSGVGGIIVSSLDGVTWILRSSGKSSGISCDLYAVAYGNDIFVAVGYDYWKEHGGILVSPDGITWTTRVSPKHGLHGVTYGNGTFVAVGYDTILTSLDGVTWTEESSVGAALYAVAYGNGTFVAVGSCGSSDCVTILTSQDAVNWTRRGGPTLSSFGPSFLGITYGNGTFVAVGENGIIFTSPDGVAWTERTSGLVPYHSYLREAAYGNGAFVAVGDYGTILTSLDGMTWTQREAIADLSGVTYGIGTFVAVGPYGTIIQSDPLPSPQISVYPISCDFGNVNAGEGSEKPVTIRNDGGDNLLIGTITSPASPFSKASDNCSGATLAPGKDCTVTYRFSPTSAGTFSSSSNIPSNDPDNSVVTISLSGAREYINLSTPLNNTSFNICSLYSLPTFSWGVGDTFGTLELQFSSDQNFSSIPVKVKLSGTSTETVINSNIWKNVLSIPGASGGTAHWRVVGTRANRTTAISDVRSIIIEPAQPVTNSTISPTSKSSLPQLSWNNNCNTKFKVWFGSDNNFTKKTTYTFNVKDPNNNGGVFVKTLTSSQWIAITNLVRKASDPTIYWYVESWDGLGRHNQTDVMNFVLTE